MKKNEIILNDNYAIIKIQHKLRGNYDCIIDKEDVKTLSKYYWTLKYDKRHPNLIGYIETRINGKRVFIHRLLMKNPKGMVIDHINGNTLDNRKSNLKVCTQSLNCKNRPNAKNIYYNKRDDLYTVSFNINGKCKYLCYTRDLKEAQKYVKLGKTLLLQGKTEQLLTIPCKCIEIPKHNKTGFLGVHMANNKYQARYKGQYLGTFNTIDEARKVIEKVKNLPLAK